MKIKHETVFYSWQSDLPNNNNRSFIEKCIEQAIKNVSKNEELLVKPVIDRDTKGTAGSPNIVSTIFKKIDECRIFVCDVSLVYPSKIQSLELQSKRRFPNPNVMIELGYAVKSKGWDNILCISNKDNGEVKELPFDITQQSIMTYSIINDGSEGAKKKLIAQLEKKLISILSLPDKQNDILSLKIVRNKKQNNSLIDNIIRKKHWLFDVKEISDYGESVQFNNYLSILSKNPLLNKDYYRECAEFIYFHDIFEPISVEVHNNGTKSLNDVKFLISIDKKAVALVENDDFPQCPKDNYGLGFTNSNFSLRRDVFPRDEDVIIEQNKHKINVEIKYGKVHAGQTKLSEMFYISSEITQNLDIKGSIFCDEYTKPQNVSLDLNFEVIQQEFSEYHLMRILRTYYFFEQQKVY